MSINLIDGDLFTYRCASSCEPTKAKPYLEDCSTALFRLHDLIQRVIKETNNSQCVFYIGGEDNFREKLYPEYKANRTRPKPTWLNDCREILVTQYGATIVNGMETDDALGIEQTKYNGEATIVSIDKDLLQIPGKHFNFVKSEFTLVSPLDGLKTFYKQLIAGDGTDNIPSYDGKIRGSIPKFIEKLQAPIDEMTDETSMYEYVQDVYFSVTSGDAEELCYAKEKLHLNAQLLYILKEPEVFWKPPA